MSSITSVAWLEGPSPTGWLLFSLVPSILLHPQNAVTAGSLQVSFLELTEMKIVCSALAKDMTRVPGSVRRVYSNGWWGGKAKSVEPRCCRRNLRISASTSA